MFICKGADDVIKSGNAQMCFGKQTTYFDT